jgi:hypothetical protein
MLPKNQEMNDIHSVNTKFLTSLPCNDDQKTLHVMFLWLYKAWLMANSIIRQWKSYLNVVLLLHKLYVCCYQHVKVHPTQ